MKYKLSKLALCFIALVSCVVKAQGNMQEAEKALDVLMSDVVNIDNKSSVVKKSKPTHYKIVYGDTLDQIIIDHVEKMPVRKDILKRAIVHANPQAFNRNNPNWMISGRKLKLPDVEDLSKLIFTDSARVEMLRGKDRDNWVRHP